MIGCDLHHSLHEMPWSFSPDIHRVNYVRADISEWRQISRVIDEHGPFDFVYHAAAEFGRWNGEDFYEQLWKTNVIGTKHILRLQQKHRFRLIHFSSSEVYGDWQNTMGESIMDDCEIKQLNDYAITKWVNELQIRNESSQHRTESVVVRLFNTYGPGEYYNPYRSVVCRFLYLALTGNKWIVHKGHQRTSLYLADAVRTLANIADNFRSGQTYNIAGESFHTIEELSKMVIEITKANPSLETIVESESFTTKFKKPDITKSILDLKHSNSIDIRYGLSITANWMIQEYGLNSPST